MFSLSTDAANAVLNAIVAEADAGAGAAKIKLYSGTPPASARVAPSENVLLATLLCSDPVGTVADGVLTFDSITDDSAAAATGIASFFRLTDSDDKVAAQGLVSDLDGDGDIKLTTTSIVQDGIVTLDSASLSV
jgi:hypothetical protein